MDILLDSRVLAVLGLLILAPVLFVARLLWAAIQTEKAPHYASEDFFTNPDGSKGRFPVITDPASLLVSIVVPAYKEEKRISRMMDEMLAYLNHEASPSFTWEIVIIDDGSKDNTAGLVQEKYVNALGTEKVRLLRLAVNNGKGGAVRKGMVRGRGQYLIMVDADGATKASDLGRLLEELQRVERGGLGIAIGSRAHLSDPAAAGGVSRTPLRRFLMWGFHTFIQLMIGGGGTAIKDTQCGFKMFTRASAALLFPVQHIDRWAFDVELLYLAARKAIPMVEVPVTWAEIDGSTMDLMSDAPKMARDIAAIRIAYMLGVWSDSDTRARTIDNLGAYANLPQTAAATEAAVPPPVPAEAPDAPAPSPVSSGSSSRRRRHA